MNKEKDCCYDGCDDEVVKTIEDLDFCQEHLEDYLRLSPQQLVEIEEECYRIMAEDGLLEKEMIGYKLRERPLALNIGYKITAFDEYWDGTAERRIIDFAIGKRKGQCLFWERIYIK